MRQVCFMHIPRTSGTVLKNMMNLLLKPTMRVEVDIDWEKLAKMDREELASIDVIAGHFGYCIHQLLPPSIGLILITFLRDPVQRAISSYNFMRLVGFHYMHKEANEMTLMEFARNPETQPFLSNLQALYVTCNTDFRVAVQGKSDAEIVRSFETRRPIPDDELLDLAKLRIDQLAFTGISERFYESIHLLWKILEWPPGINIHPDSKSHDRAAIDKRTPDEVEYLESINRVDRQLYNYAWQKLDSYSDS